MGRRGGSQLGVQARKMGCGWMAGWPGGGKRGLGWGPAPRGQREAGRGGRSHALAPCRSVLSPGQGQTMGGLLLLGAWGGGSQAGGREGAKGGLRVMHGPSARLDPGPARILSPGTPGGGLRSTKRSPGCNGTAPRGAGQGCPPPAPAKSPGEELAQAKGAGRWGRSPPATPHQNQHHHPARSHTKTSVTIPQQPRGGCG